MTSSSEKPVVLLDVDGVIADFTSLFGNAVMVANASPRGWNPYGWDPKQWNLARDLGLTKEQERTVNSILGMPGLALTMNALSGAVEGVKELISIAEVYFVTSPLDGNTTWAYDRCSWLCSYFGDVGKNVVSTEHKSLVHGDVFVDDKPENCASWKKQWPAGLVIHWGGRGETPVGTIPVKDWKRLKSLVETRGRIPAYAAFKHAST